MKTENVLNGIVSFVDYEIVSHPKIDQYDKAKIVAAVELGLINPRKMIEALTKSTFFDGSLLWENEEKTEINVQTLKNTAYKVLDVFGGEYPLTEGIKFDLSSLGIPFLQGLNVAILKGFVIQKSTLDKLFEHIEAI